MARLPLYTQQTTAQAPQASAQTFGADVAQATQGLGNQVFDLGAAMQKRESTMQGIVEFGDFNDRLRQDIEAVRSQGNIALGSTVDAFREAAMRRVDESMSRVSGNAEFRANYKNQLVNQVSQYVQSVRSDQVKAQYTLAQQYVEDLSGKMAVDLAMTPDKLDDYMTVYNMGLDKFEGAFDQNTVSRMRKAGASQMIQTAIASMQETGNWQAAKQIIERPDVKELLAGEQGITLTLRNMKLERQAQQEEAGLARNASLWSGFLGRSVSPQEAQTLPNFEKLSSPTERARALQLFRGPDKPVTPAEFEQLMGLGQGQGATGRMTLGEQALLINSGNATPAQLIDFQAAAMKEFASLLRENPQGRPEFIANPNMPPAVRQALQASGFLIPSGVATQMPLVGGPPLNGAVAPPEPMPAPGAVPSMSQLTPIAGGGFQDANGQQYSMGPDGQLRPDFFAQPAQPGEAATAPAAAPGPSGQPRVSNREGPRTIFQALDVTAGPVNKALGTARRVFGNLGPEAGSEAVTNQPMVEGFINRSVQFFASNSGRLLAAEREDLIREVGKLNPTFSSETGAMEAAFGLDVTMERVMERALASANDSSLSAADSNEARKLYGDIKAMREQLGVVRPKTQRELKQMYQEGRLDIGQMFFMPDGKPVRFDQSIHDQLFGTKK